MGMPRPKGPGEAVSTREQLQEEKWLQAKALQEAERKALQEKTAQLKAIRLAAQKRKEIRSNGEGA
jgi:hypothetical protein